MTALGRAWRDAQELTAEVPGDGEVRALAHPSLVGVPEVGVDDVAEVVSRQTGVPVSQLTQQEVQRLLRRVPEDGQRLLFSATLDSAVAQLVREFLPDPSVHPKVNRRMFLATAASVPAMAAWISLSIFIASLTSTAWPAVTESPTATSTSTTLPGMLVVTWPGWLA